MQYEIMESKPRLTFEELHTFIIGRSFSSNEMRHLHTALYAFWVLEHMGDTFQKYEGDRSTPAYLAQLDAVVDHIDRKHMFNRNAVKRALRNFGVRFSPAHNALCDKDASMTPAMLYTYMGKSDAAELAAEARPHGWGTLWRMLRRFHPDNLTEGVPPTATDYVNTDTLSILEAVNILKPYPIVRSRRGALSHRLRTLCWINRVLSTYGDDKLSLLEFVDVARIISRFYPAYLSAVVDDPSVSPAMNPMMSKELDDLYAHWAKLANEQSAAKTVESKDDHA